MASCRRRCRWRCRKIKVSWDTGHVLMPKIFRNVSLSSALYKCYKGVDPFAWGIVYARPRGVGRSPSAYVTYLLTPFSRPMHRPSFTTLAISLIKPFLMAGFLLSTGLGVFSWAYMKQRRNKRDRKRDLEEMDSFLMNLPHVSNLYLTTPDSWHRLFNSIDRH